MHAGRNALRLSWIPIIAGVIGVFVGCRTQDEASDNAKDCTDICDKYQQCFEAAYDAEGCFTRCDDNAAADLNYEFSVDRCSTCMRDHTCPELPQFCLRECAGILEVEAPAPVTQ